LRKEEKSERPTTLCSGEEEGSTPGVEQERWTGKRREKEKENEETPRRRLKASGGEKTGSKILAWIPVQAQGKKPAAQAKKNLLNPQKEIRKFRKPRPKEENTGLEVQKFLFSKVEKKDGKPIPGKRNACEKKSQD